MNIKKRLEHLATHTAKDRATGRTTLIARAVKELDGVLLTHNFDYATELQREHGIVVKSVDMNLEGYNGPFFFDHRAVERLLMRAANAIQQRDEQIKALIDALSHYERAVQNATQISDRVKDEIKSESI